MAEEAVEYGRFVLVGHGRSGSTVMTEGLRDNRSIRMYGEVFHEEQLERVRSMGGDRHYHDGEDGAEYLRSVVFRARRWERLRAVGFKLFADHARLRPASKAWDYLIADRSIRVVILHRANLLSALVSYEAAVRSDEWALPVGMASSQELVLPFRLNPVRCEDYFDSIRKNHSWLRDTFSDHAVVELEYARDVSGRFEKTMARLYDFLDVPRNRCRPKLQKQARLTPREQLSNYDELRRYFARTPYKVFFEADEEL